jgi:hypothetical protein
VRAIPFRVEPMKETVGKRRHAPVTESGPTWVIT